MSIIGTSPDKTVSMNNIKHDAYDALLKKYVDKNGDVDYSGWKKNDVDTLSDYLESLSAADPEKPASKENTLAFWINAYNALTIYGILEKYPTSSIRNHTSKLFGYNIWKDLQLKVDEDAYSLDEIEHDILRKMDEARIHYAIVCAAKSCPRLLNEAFTGDKLEQQLVKNAKHFFAQDGNFQIDENRGRVKLSSILKWFGEDFGETESELLETIQPYISEESAEMLNSTNTWKVSYLSYNWKLNDQKSK
ncbi:MAG: DUF547 domain-containing protein [Gammaproteobacteria bacterium]|nr:DUF547 domain-containing protein [Gammaproteobacteria bacterium]